MRTIKPILIAALLFSASFAEAQYTSYNPFGLAYTTSNNNLHGQVKEISIFGEDPTLESNWTSTCQYNRDGLLTEYEQWSYGGGEHYLCIYNENRLDRIIATNDSTYGWFFSYNDKGCPAMQIRRQVNTDTIRYICDEQCRIVEEYIGTNVQTSYTYDTSSRIITMTFDKTLTQYIYDTQGHMTKQTTQNGDFVRTETYTYNDYGDMTEYRQYTSNDDDLLILQYTYTYDHYGNWITCSGNEFYETRTITYYSN